MEANRPSYWHDGKLSYMCIWILTLAVINCFEDDFNLQNLLYNMRWINNRDCYKNVIIETNKRTVKDFNWGQWVLAPNSLTASSVKTGGGGEPGLDNIKHNFNVTGKNVVDLEWNDKNHWWFQISIRSLCICLNMLGDIYKKFICFVDI